LTINFLFILRKSVNYSVILFLIERWAQLLIAVNAFRCIHSRSSCCRIQRSQFWRVNSTKSAKLVRITVGRLCIQFLLVVADDAVWTELLLVADTLLSVCNNNNNNSYNMLSVLSVSLPLVCLYTCLSFRLSVWLSMYVSVFLYDGPESDLEVCHW